MDGCDWGREGERERESERERERKELKSMEEEKRVNIGHLGLTNNMAYVVAQTRSSFRRHVLIVEEWGTVINFFKVQTKRQRGIVKSDCKVVSKVSKLS